MDLAKQNWTKADKKEFAAFLVAQKNPQKIEFTKRVVNTYLPVLAIPTPCIKKIANQIGRGGIISFLNLKLKSYYEMCLINGFLICKLKDFEIFKTYLIEYANYIDNWACCDQLTFDVSKNPDKFFALSKELFASPLPYARRIAVRIWFKFINTEFLSAIFDLINASSQKENEYYVNMAIAWFLCECYIKQPTLTRAFLLDHKLNDFTVKKFVSKCCDSFRVSPSDKQNLKKLCAKW